MPTSSSFGNRYLATSAGSLSILTELQLYVVEELRHRVAGRLQPPQRASHHVSGSVRVGSEIVDHEGDAKPGQNLLHNPGHLPTRTHGSCRRRLPQHSPVPIADQWQSTLCVTIASKGSQPSPTTPILGRKPLLYLLRRAGFRADWPRGRLAPC